MRTTVVNLKREPYDVYIGRAGRGLDGYFGNPYHIGRDGTRVEVIEQYSVWFFRRIDADARFRHAVLELRGKRLGCFCAPLACHGDIIVGWIDRQFDDRPAPAAS